MFQKKRKGGKINKVMEKYVSETKKRKVGKI